MIIGTFDVDNYGDCLFPDIVRHELECRMENVETQLYSPTARVSKLGNYSQVYALPGTVEECKFIDFDAIIVAGGEVLNNGHNASGLYCSIRPNTMSSGMRMWMSPAIIKKWYGTPYVFNAVGVGRLDEQAKNGLSSVLKFANYKSVRDQHSADILSMAGSNISVETDSGFMLPRALAHINLQETARRVIPSGLALNSYLVIQASMNYLVGRFDQWCSVVSEIKRICNQPILLLPICYHNSDHMILRKALHKLNELGIKTALTKYYLNIIETASVISCSTGYFGTSLHGAITAIAFKKPLCVLCNSIPGKHEGVLKTVGLEMNVTNNLKHVPFIFENSLSMDVEVPAAKGMKGALKGFEDMFAALNGKTLSSKKQIDNENWQIMLNAIEFEKKYYNKNLLIKRKLFNIIRSKTYLSDLYNLLSYLKKT